MIPTLRFAEIRQTFGHNSWQNMLAREFETTLTSKSRPFPCVFGVWAFGADTLRFAFPDPFDPKTLAPVLTDYLASARDIGPRTALITFARPGPVRPLQHYRRRFWTLLDGLERIDTKPRPEAIPRQIDDPLWEFCFGGEGMFISVATPANVLRQSRRASSLTLVFQPRWIFDGITTGTGGRIHPAIDEIRKRIAGYDGLAPSPSLGLYGDPAKREAEQYFLGDTNRREEGKESKMAQGLSPTSRMVLDLLREDSRRTATEIAHHLGVSRTTIAYHIARLTKDGTIRRFTIDVDPAATALPQGVRAMFDVVLSRGSCLNLYPAIAPWKELVSCWSTSGSVDMRILVEAASHGRIDELRERLGRHPNVANLTTSFILRTFEENRSVFSVGDLAESESEQAGT